jgi:hypothetical protein
MVFMRPPALRGNSLQHRRMVAPPDQQQRQAHATVHASITPPMLNLPLAIQAWVRLIRLK